MFDENEDIGLPDEDELDGVDVSKADTVDISEPLPEKPKKRGRKDGGGDGIPGDGRRGKNPWN